ncbi:MAG: spermidine/putrescine ABC transporter substrate-binding protein [Planctomycetes bacterium]|nr:spermidine/putrescine ABC transporter substrate-binding protein [Planctomycetota bacterium]
MGEHELSPVRGPESSPRSSVSRRRFLGRSALLAGAVAFGDGILDVARRTAAADGPGTPQPPPLEEKRTVRISNWPLYIDAKTVQEFEVATGFKAVYTEDVNDNNEFFAKIDEPLKRGQSIDRDLIVLTDWMAGRLIKLGYTQPIDAAKFPNKANLVEALRGVGFDPGRVHSVPWVSGMTGLGYNPKRLGRELTSVNDIFAPELKGKVTMLTEMRDTIGLVLLGEGADPAKCTLAEAKAAAAKIKKYREAGHFRGFTGNDYAADLAAGNIAVAFAWSGDVQGLTKDNPDLRWVAPKEGAMLYSDNMLIPKTSDRGDLAAAFMNYVYEPAHAAQIIAAAPYLSPVKGVDAELAKLDAGLAKSPLVNPPAEVRARLHVFRWLEDAEDKELNKAFQDAIGA